MGGGFLSSRSPLSARQRLPTTTSAPPVPTEKKRKKKSQTHLRLLLILLTHPPPPTPIPRPRRRGRIPRRPRTRDEWRGRTIPFDRQNVAECCGAFCLLWFQCARAAEGGGLAFFLLRGGKRGRRTVGKKDFSFRLMEPIVCVLLVLMSFRDEGVAWGLVGRTISMGSTFYLFMLELGRDVAFAFPRQDKGGLLRVR